MEEQFIQNESKQINQIDIKEIMINFERSSFVDEIKEYYQQGLIDKDLYVLLSQSDLSTKLKVYQYPKSGLVYKMVNKLLIIYYRLLFKIFEPVLNSQEKINKKLALEIIKLKVVDKIGHKDGTKKE